MEINTITTSYSRKINHALYGGGQYESSDHFCSLSAELEVGEDPVVAHKQLAESCRVLVESSLDSEITSFAGGLNAEDFYDYLRDLVARRPIDGEVYYRCNKRQQAVLQAAKRGLQMSKRDDRKETTIEPIEEVVTKPKKKA
jgi:hypothetical protein